MARTSVSDEGLIKRIDVARTRTLNWLDRLQVAEAPRGVVRISTAHDQRRWPDMLLPGTYNAIICRQLLGGLDNWSAQERSALVSWFEAFRLPDGRSRMPAMRDADVFKKPDLTETWRYIDWHVTNYTLGAIEALAPDQRPNLAFSGSYLDPMRLAAWLAHRDMRDPWQEGNNIVNLGSFFLLMKRFGDTGTGGRVDAALEILFDWHDRNQEPTTGFWGVGQLSDPTRLLHAMAGSMHNYHLWYALDRSLPGQAFAADYCLTLPTAIDSACIDTDAVDVLVHALDILGHRRAETEQWLRAKLVALLDFQNDDGGFADVRDGIRRLDGWVKGYEEPQGLSNTFATWFRWIAIAMIADALWSRRWSWQFRRMVGIGYRKEPRG
jgi:hypothetical protein